jgi:hypothetical protein
MAFFRLVLVWIDDMLPPPHFGQQSCLNSKMWLQLLHMTFSRTASGLPIDDGLTLVFPAAVPSRVGNPSLWCVSVLAGSDSQKPSIGVSNVE